MATDLQAPPIVSLNDPDIQHQVAVLRQTDNLAGWYYIAREYLFLALTVGLTVAFSSLIFVGVSSSSAQLTNSLTIVGQPTLAFKGLVVNATLGIADAILSEAYISFLGLGIQPPTATWGSMLDGAYRYLEQAPWLWIFPGSLILLTVLAINFVGDGLRDALDPRVLVA